MGFVQTRGIEELDRLEGIKGGKIPALDIQYLTNFSKSHNVISLALPNQPTDFSMPKRFFVSKQTKLVFIKDGRMLPFAAVDVDNQNFIAFQLKKQKLYVYAYFAEDYDTI